MPEHWHTAGPRTSRVDTKRARKAITPVHAALNYAYAILEVEATIAAHIVGFDPSLGIMHADVRYRGSLATDLMEPVRPIADRLVLELLERPPWLEATSSKRAKGFAGSARDGGRACSTRPGIP